MNKNLLRVIVYGAYFLIVFGLLQLISPMISFKNHTIFTPMGIVWFITVVLILSLASFGTRFILRKYGAQITPVTSPRAKTIVWVILILSFFMLLFGPYLFFNGSLPFSVFSK